MASKGKRKSNSLDYDDSDEDWQAYPTTSKKPRPSSENAPAKRQSVINVNKSRKILLSEINDALWKIDPENASELVASEEQVREEESEEAELASQRPRLTGGSGSGPSQSCYTPSLTPATEAKFANIMEQLTQLKTFCEERFQAMDSSLGKLNDRVEKIETETVPKVETILAEFESIKTTSKQVQGDTEIDLAMIKRDLWKFFPLNTVGPEVEYLFSFLEIKQALIEIFRDYLRRKNITNPDSNQIGVAFINIFFSEQLRAHLYWGESKEKSEAGGGWDKLPVQQCIMDFYTEYIEGLATFPGLKKQPAKGARDNKAYKFDNSRVKYFAYLCRDNPTVYGFLKARYNQKLWFYNNVKGKLRSFTSPPPSFAEEVKNYFESYSASSAPSPEEMHQKPCPVRIPAKMALTEGDQITTERVDEIVGVLIDCGYGKKQKGGAAANAATVASSAKKADQIPNKPKPRPKSKQLITLPIDPLDLEVVDASAEDNIFEMDEIEMKYEPGSDSE